MSKTLEEIRKKYQGGNIPIVEYHGKLYTPDADYVEYCSEINRMIAEHNSRLDKTEEDVSRISSIFDAQLESYSLGLMLLLVSHFFSNAFYEDTLSSERTDYCARLKWIKQYDEITLISVTEYNNILIMNKEDRVKEEVDIAQRCIERQQKKIEIKRLIRLLMIEVKKKQEEYQKSLDYQYEQMKNFRKANKDYVEQREQQEREERLAQMEREYQKRLENARRMEQEAEAMRREAKERERERQKQLENENRYGSSGLDNERKIFSAVQRGNCVTAYGKNGNILFNTFGTLINWTSDNVVICPHRGSSRYIIYDASGNRVGDTPSL